MASRIHILLFLVSLLLVCACSPDEREPQGSRGGARSDTTENVPPQPSTAIQPPREATLPIQNHLGSEVASQRPIFARIALNTTSRTYILEGTTVEGPVEARVLVESIEAGGLLLSTPTAAYRLPAVIEQGSFPTPRPAVDAPNSEFVLKESFALIAGNLVAGNPSAPPLFRLLSNGDLVWVAGEAMFEDVDGVEHNIAISSHSVYIGKLESQNALDREEAVYSLGILARQSPDSALIVEQIVIRLKDADVYVRRSAAEVLLEHAVSSDLTRIEEALATEKDTWTQGILRATLARLQPDDTPALQVSANEQESRLVVRAAPQKGSVMIGDEVIEYTYDLETSRGSYWVAKLL